MKSHLLFNAPITPKPNDDGKKNQERFQFENVEFGVDDIPLSIVNTLCGILNSMDIVDEMKIHSIAAKTDGRTDNLC